LQCYNHNDTPAVAICLSCGKALCKGCSVNAGDFLVCSDTCKSWISKQRSLREKESKNYLLMSKFMASIGVVFGLIAIYHLFIADKIFSALGIFLSALAAVNFVFAYFLNKYYRSFKPDKIKQ
jgi:hypothetical protein